MEKELLRLIESYERRINLLQNQEAELKNITYPSIDELHQKRQLTTVIFLWKQVIKDLRIISDKK